MWLVLFPIYLHILENVPFVALGFVVCVAFFFLFFFNLICRNPRLIILLLWINEIDSVTENSLSIDVQIIVFLFSELLLGKSVERVKVNMPIRFFEILLVLNKTFGRCWILVNKSCQYSSLLIWSKIHMFQILIIALAKLVFFYQNKLACLIIYLYT